ncbi:MAG TPA: hypothetical protein VNM24_14660 [Burkholderiales bacterium]|jgi:hypothetical protein|nr:hypothetical protein [Burkholderiales bacterium]
MESQSWFATAILRLVLPLAFAYLLCLLGVIALAARSLRSGQSTGETSGAFPEVHRDNSPSTPQGWRT